MSQSRRMLPPDLEHATWLRAEATQAVMRILREAGHETRAVGGCVRNALLGEPISDIDLATTAPPPAVMRVCAAAGLKVVATGLVHGTVTVVADGVAFEVTTLRTDVATDGRHAVVAFTGDWIEDAKRRDLTINAIYSDAAGRLHDPVGGIADLEQRRVRFIGDPVKRIREDYLRILRFFRFHARYASGAPDAAGLAACIAQRAGLKRLSAERVGAELAALLEVPGADDVVAVMAASGILGALLGVAPAPGRLAALASLERELTRPVDAMARMAVLAVHTLEDVQRLAERLRLSNADRARLAVLVEPWPRPDPGDLGVGRWVRANLYRSGRPAAIARALVAWSEAPSRQPGARPTSKAAWVALLASAESQPIPVLPVQGRDVLALGVRAGPEVGKVVAGFETWWLEQGMPNDAAIVAIGLERAIAAVRAAPDTSPA